MKQVSKITGAGEGKAAPDAVHESRIAANMAEQAKTGERGLMTLHICTPNGEEQIVECDTLHFSMPDGTDGRGGGRIGIRPGHAASLIAMAPGLLEAFRAGSPVLQMQVGGGFASVKRNTVTVLLDSVQKFKNEKGQS